MMKGPIGPWIGSTRSPFHTGADRVVDYTAEDFTRDERDYDVVLNAVGKSSSAAADDC
jgi:NADPH:quinone reductase-like Zn-dependent oxidoreductase